MMTLAIKIGKILYYNNRQGEENLLNGRVFLAGRAKSREDFLAVYLIAYHKLGGSSRLILVSCGRRRRRWILFNKL